MNRYQLHCPTQRALRSALTKLYKLGFRYHGNVPTVKTAFNGFCNYPWLVINPEEKYIGGNKCSYPKLQTITASQLRQWPKFVEPLKVALNAAYIAEISREGITVGCQTFPLSVIDKLVKARKKVLA